METKKIIAINTGRKEKMVIGGHTVLEDVYKVDISTLYYNDENGRIATFIAEYKSKSDIAINELSFDEYNETIMQFIIDSKKDKYKTTKEDIKKNGQLRVGIILDDGRVIDGNRRFTCLRELYNETADEKYQYFECVILKVPTTLNDKKMIKSLELKYQFGEDDRVDYNAIDKLVDVYNLLVGPNRIFSAKEYCDRVNNQIKLNDVKRMMVKAEVMYDYLDFIGMKERYDIARDYKLDGPIQEIANLKSSLSDFEWNEVKPIMYKAMKDATGDRTREVRSIIKVYKNSPSEFEKIRNNFLNIEFKQEQIKHSQLENSQVVAQKEELSDLKAEYKELVKDSIAKTGIDMARKKQNELLKGVVKKMSEIDKISLKHLPEDLKKEFMQYLNQLEMEIAICKKEIE